MPTVKLNKKDISDNKDNEPNKNTTVEKVEPLHFEEKSLSSKKEIEPRTNRFQSYRTF